jgi:hypothetical protein
MELHPVEQRVVADRAGVGRPPPQRLAILLAGAAQVVFADAAKGTSSTESTSMCAGPTGYRPPSFTFGRRQSRKETVIAPEITSSRSSRLNSTPPMVVAWWPVFRALAGPPVVLRACTGWG